MIGPTTTYTAGGLSVVLTFISTIVCGGLVQKLSDDHADTGNLLFADMAFNIICCMALIFSTIVFVPKKGQDGWVRWGSWRHLTLTTVGFVLLLTVALTAATAQLTREQLGSGHGSDSSPRPTTKLFRAWMCLWAFSLVSQVVFYALLLRVNRPVKEQDRVAGSSSPDHEIRSISRSISKLHRGHARHSGDYPCSKLGQRSTSSQSVQRDGQSDNAQRGKQPLDLLRRSIRGMHTLSSKIMDALFVKESGKPVQAGPAHFTLAQPKHEHGGFDQWEPSDFARELHETLDLGRRKNHLTLKSLPQVPQDGHLREDRNDSPPLPLSPTLVNSASSWSPSPSPSSPTARSPTSPEHNIHPLFRVDGQSPPPTPTPGTSITGPSQTRTIGAHGLRRMRSNGSMYPRSSYDRSEFSLDNVIHEQDEEHEEVEAEEPTPSSLAPTIPPFILEADLRRSFAEYEYGKSSY